MGRWKEQYGYITKKGVFKTTYILCGVLNIFALASLWTTYFHDKELNFYKWLGGIVGTIQEALVMLIVYSLCNLLDLTVLGVIIFVAYFLFLIFFGIFYKTE